MSVSLNPEAWTTIWILVAALMGGIVGKVWGPLRRTIAAVDVVAGRPERYPGDEEKRPGLAERLDNIDTAIRGIRTEVTAMRSEVDDVRNHVTNLETECPS
jgi:hypothetical protein